MRPLIRLARSPGVVTLVAALACGSDSGSTNPRSLPECTGNVSIQVSAGIQPTFSWTPACRLFVLGVESASSGSDQWVIISAGANRITPGVRYGTVPAGAAQLEAPAPLARGQSYDVFLGRYTGPDPDDGVLIGVKAFTP